jgi:O-antigen ligase
LPVFWHTGQVLSKNITRGDVAFLLAFGSATGGLFSIAVCHILLGAAVAWLIVVERRLRFPGVAVAAAAFLIWTLVSLACSDDPAAGWPQIRKFYVWLMLGAVFTTIGSLGRRRLLLLAMAAAATLSATWSLVQFAVKYRRAAVAGMPFYESYIGDRITGFMSHWMTFSGEIAMALAILLAWLLFERPKGRPLIAGLAAAALLAVAQMLGLTRSMWAASGVSVIYLVWRWKPRYLLAIPVLLGLTVAAAPEPVRSRIISIWKPSRLDSNQHRVLLRATGVRIIEAHPLFGLGPERVKAHFLEYVPPEAPVPWPVEWYYEHLHNFYIHYAAERGLPSILALLGFLLASLWHFARRRDWAGHAAAACILGIMTGGWGEVNLGDSEVLSMFLSIIGCAWTPPEQVDA